MNYEAPLWIELEVKTDGSDLMENISTVYFEENQANRTVL
jgi:hypothetical protein